MQSGRNSIAAGVPSAYSYMTISNNSALRSRRCHERYPYERPIQDVRGGPNQTGGHRLGTLLLILLVVLVLAALIGAGGYSVRRYWSPVGSEVVETEGTTAGAGTGIAAAILALFVLIILFLGFTQWNWFGASSQPSTPSNTTTVTSPAPAPGGGGGTHPSPSATPS